MQLKHHRTNAQNKRETWFGYLNSSYSNHKHYISTCNHLKHNINYKQTTITVTWICVKNKKYKNGVISNYGESIENEIILQNSGTLIEMFDLYFLH